MKPNKTRPRLLVLAASLAASLAAGGAMAAGWTITDLGPTNTGDRALKDPGRVAVANRVMSPATASHASALVQGADGSFNKLRLRDIDNLSPVLGVDASRGMMSAFNRQAGTRMSRPELAKVSHPVQSAAASPGERGQIIGLGSVSGDASRAHVFLLTPVPEPAAWAMLMFGLAGLLAWAEQPGQRRRTWP